MHAQQASNTRKNISNLSNQALGRSLVYTAADPRSACQISKFQNFHNFLNPHQPKGCFLSDRQKSPKFNAIKNVKKKEPIAVFFIFFLKKDRQRQPAPPTPKRSKKSILIFAHFFSIFVSGSSMRFESSKTHSSEVNIDRVMTQNRIALFKPRPL